MSLNFLKLSTSISTSVPGIQISELLPKTAMQMDSLSLVRSMSTAREPANPGGCSAR